MHVHNVNASLLQVLCKCIMHVGSLTKHDSNFLKVNVKYNASFAVDAQCLTCNSKLPGRTVVFLCFVTESLHHSRTILTNSNSVEADLFQKKETKDPAKRKR